MKKLLAGAAVVLGIAGFTTQSEVAPIPVELVLAIDSSGSISGADFLLQRNAYAAVLGSSLITTDGTIAIGVLNFSNTVQTVFNLQVIDSLAKKNALVAAINGMSQIGSTTAIGDAINAAVAMLAGLSHADNNELIDVSTDGASNTGANASTASDAAGAAGVAVNCLGVGPGANCSFNDGEGFDILVDSFADFQTALELKIRQETGVPEPATLGLVGLGLVGMGLAARRRKTA